MHAAFILDKTLGYPELRYIIQIRNPALHIVWNAGLF